MKDSYAFYKDKLNAEYKPVFEQVEMYILTQNIDESTTEGRLGDLLDTFLSAQDAGKPVQKIVGNNIEQFCKTFCSDFGIKNRILRILDWLKSIAWLFVVISVIDMLWLVFDVADTGEIDLWHSVSSLNISMYFTSIILFSALFTITNIVIRSVMFKKKRISMGILKAIICAEAFIGFCGIFMIITFSKVSLFDVPTWIVALISGIYLLIYYPMFGKRIKRQKIKLSDLVQDDVQTELSDFMEKRFEKAKKKNLRKGKGELTLAAYLDDEEKSCNRSERLKLFYSVLPLAVTAIAYIITYLIDGFETVTDSILFIIIILSVEYSILWGLWKIVKQGIETRRAWIHAKRNELEQIKDIESCD